MIADRRHTEEQGIRNLLVSQAFCQQTQHIQFPLGELNTFGKAESCHGRFVRKDTLPCHSPIHDLQQRLFLHFLIPERIHTDLPGPLQEHTVRHRCHNNDLRPGTRCLDSRGSFQTIGAVIHDDIHKDKIHLHARTVGICNFGGLYRSHQLISAARTHKAFKKLSRHDLVIHNQYLICHSIPPLEAQVRPRKTDSSESSFFLPPALSDHEEGPVRLFLQFHPPASFRYWSGPP